MARNWQLVARPQGLPRLEDFALVEVAPPDPGPGEVHVRNRWLSVDPYMRGRMNDMKSYVPPFVLNAPLDGGAIGEVVASQADGFAPGDLVSHMLGWRDEAVGPAAAFTKLPDLGVPEQAFLGHLGMPGMTAYFGLLEVAGAKAGDVVFVSGAAGAVGLAVVQIAKIKGMTVIGSAGGPEKCALVRDIGADHAIDYKAEGRLADRLAEVAPDGIDVYFDNVGGEHLDAALGAARLHARFAICGMIDMYNGAPQPPMRNAFRIIGNRVRLQGFIVFDFFGRAAEFQREMGGWIADGRFRTQETVREGLEAVPAAFLELFSGGNVGKMVVRV